MMKIHDILRDYIDQQSATAIAGGSKSASLLAQCDAAYSRFLLGQPVFSAEALSLFLETAGACRLAGTAGEGEAINVHLTAYILGTLNLASADHKALVSEFVARQDWQWEQIFHRDTLLPKWPWKYTHHSWRVSHWVGGAPSIIKSVRRLAPERAAERALPAVQDLLKASDALIDPRTGLLRTYKSDALQFVFRQIYKLRHDPDVGDVGGIVHLHWVNYAEGRLPYKANAALFERAWAIMQRAPFIEKAPYCLDFDIVQIVRTAAPTPAALDGAVKARAGRFAEDTIDFLTNRIDADYTLHKLPGALATVHECALIRGDSQAHGLGIAPIDIIKDAFWI